MDQDIANAVDELNFELVEQLDDSACEEGAFLTYSYSFGYERISFGHDDETIWDTEETGPRPYEEDCEGNFIREVPWLEHIRNCLKLHLEARTKLFAEVLKVL